MTHASCLYQIGSASKASVHTTLQVVILELYIRKTRNSNVAIDRMLLTHIAMHLSISVAFTSLPTVSIYIIYVYTQSKHAHTHIHKWYIVYIAVLLTGKCHLQSLLSSRASTVMSAEF